MLRFLGVLCLSGHEAAFPQVGHFDSSEWGIEKYVLNAKSGTGLALQKFLLKHKICEAKTACPTDLGCGSLRSWCFINTPYPSQEFQAHIAELHFVESATLHDLSMPGIPGLAWDAWESYWSELNGDLSTFNAFMHNKAQFFTSDLNGVFASLHESDVPLMLRKSQDATGSLVAHIGFEVAGRIFEMVGDATQIEQASQWKFWQEDECPQAHALPATITEMSRTLRNAQWSGNNSAPMLIGIGVTTSQGGGSGTADGDNEQFGIGEPVLYRHLRQLTGAQVSARDESKCHIDELTWSSMPSLAVRYVQNQAARAGSWSLHDLDRYVQDVHSNFTGQDPSWRSWDHMLDQHLGLWYGGDEASCAERAASARTLLERDALPVGERAEPDAHLFYVGYAGPMAWEYQFMHCNGGRADWPQECACDPDNNPDNLDVPCTQRPDDWCLELDSLSV